MHIDILPNCRLAAGGGRRSIRQCACGMVEPRCLICQRYGITITMRTIRTELTAVVSLQCDIADFAE
jgi:hypothetical protein